jgi:hypothetical protein
MNITAISAVTNTQKLAQPITHNGLPLALPMVAKDLS